MPASLDKLLKIQYTETKEGDFAVTKSLIKIIPILFFTLSCSVVDKVAYKSTARMVQGSSAELMTETDWEFFKNAIPGNIKFLEGLLENGRDNENLIGSLIKAYTGYAYGVHETNYIKDKILGKDESRHKADAILFYHRALKYGFRYLDLKGVPWNKLQRSINEPEKMAEMLEDSFGTGDLETLFFLGNALASLANLQKDNMRVVSSVPIIKAIYDRVCNEDPNFHGGSCKMFYGIYELSRPRMLGGNPKKGKKHFDDGLRMYPKNYLIRLSYLEFYTIPNRNKKEFNKQMKVLENAQAEFEEDRRKFNWGKDKKRSSIGLYNAIAFKRFSIYKKYRKRALD